MKLPAWAVLAVGVAIYSVGAVTFLYDTFQTRASAEDGSRQAEKQADKVDAALQRLEGKIDRLIERRRQ